MVETTNMYEVPIPKVSTTVQAAATTRIDLIICTRIGHFIAAAPLLCNQRVGSSSLPAGTIFSQQNHIIRKNKFRRSETTFYRGLTRDLTSCNLGCRLIARRAEQNSPFLGGSAFFGTPPKHPPFQDQSPRAFFV